MRAGIAGRVWMAAIDVCAFTGPDAELVQADIWPVAIAPFVSFGTTIRAAGGRGPVYCVVAVCCSDSTSVL